MIEINLLPKELRKRKKEIEFPLQRWVTIGFLVFFVIWLLIILESQFIRLQIDRATQNWKEMQVTYSDTKKIVDTIDSKYKPMVENFDSYVRRRMVWAPALNIASDDLPENIWLTMLKAEEMSHS